MDRGIYCYRVMSFELKNTGTMYQRLVNHMFKDANEKFMEVYVNDMLVKSIQASQYLGHHEEAFRILKRYSMKLNLEKCSFGMTSGKFLGYLVTRRGIEANPQQIKAIDYIHPLTSVKEIQRLMEKLVALSHFILRYIEKDSIFLLCHQKRQLFK